MNEIAQALQMLPIPEREDLRTRLLKELQSEIYTRIVNDWETVSLRCLSNACATLADPSSNSLYYEEAGERDNIRDADALRGEILSRLLRLKEFEDNPELQAAEIEMLRGNPAAFFNRWVWMQDPRVAACPRLPFKLYDFQEGVIDFIHARYEAQESALIKKSRDMGLSVISIGYGLWLWLFHEGKVVGYGSRKETLVHRIFDLDSLIERSRYMIRMLPAWLRPSGFNERLHFNYLNVINPENGSQLKGEGGDELGRGGRASLFFADEFSYVKRQEASHQALTGTTECVIFLGTSAGPKTYFFALERRQAMPMARLPWYLDPRKIDHVKDAGDPNAPSAWAKRKLREVGPHAFAREYACDDSLALEDVLIPPDWVWAATQITITPAAGARCVAGMDLAGNTGRDESVLTIMKGGKLILMKFWKSKDLDELAALVVPLCVTNGVDQLNYDRGGLGAAFARSLAKHLAVIRFSIVPIAGNTKPTARRFDDAPKLPNMKRFKNLNTELWYSLRLRFENAFKIHCGLDVDPETAIQIPDDPTLREQLTSREIFENAQGKIQLTPKGESSPDRGDSLSLCEAPARKAKRKSPASAHGGPRNGNGGRSGAGGGGIW